MNDRLQTALRELRLSGLAQTLDVRLQEAQGHSLSHAEFLELILQDELLVRQERQIERRVKSAAFRELKALDEFDWSFNPSIPKKQMFDLATCRFIRERRDVLFLGPPGVGKSFLVQALGRQAILQGLIVLYRSIFDVVRDFLHDEAFDGQEKVLARYLKPDLLIIDDMGMKQLPKLSNKPRLEPGEGSETSYHGPFLRNTTNSTKSDQRVHETGTDSRVGETVAADSVHFAGLPDGHRLAEGSVPTHP